MSDQTLVQELARILVSPEFLPEDQLESFGHTGFHYSDVILAALKIHMMRASYTSSVCEGKPLSVKSCHEMEISFGEPMSCELIRFRERDFIINFAASDVDVELMEVTLGHTFFSEPILNHHNVSENKHTDDAVRLADEAVANSDLTLYDVQEGQGRSLSVNGNVTCSYEEYQEFNVVLFKFPKMTGYPTLCLIVDNVYEEDSLARITVENEFWELVEHKVNSRYKVTNVIGDPISMRDAALMSGRGSTSE